MFPSGVTGNHSCGGPLKLHTSSSLVSRPESVETIPRSTRCSERLRGEDGVQGDLGRVVGRWAAKSWDGISTGTPPGMTQSLGPPVERLEEVGTNFFQDVYFSRGTLPPKKGKRALLGDIGVLLNAENEQVRVSFSKAEPTSARHQ